MKINENLFNFMKNTLHLIINYDVTKLFRIITAMIIENYRTYVITNNQTIIINILPTGDSLHILYKGNYHE